ncbi:MAG: TolC family protein [Bdellovibrionales bacterium]|nr:TolC family protein [Bdellovibrionales bacterium]
MSHFFLPPRATSVAPGALIPHAVLAALILAHAPVHAAGVSFQDVWRTVSDRSHAGAAATARAEAAQVASSRASRHWLPRIWLGAQAVRTDEAGQNFFGLMGQRSVTAADFSPDQLNRPGTQTFTRGAVGLDLPLWEGGGGVARAEGSERVQKAVEAEASAARARQFAEVARSYGALLALREESAELQDLHRSVTGVIARYAVGSRSNPVGYSGLLGLRTLSNRLEGLLAENSSRGAGHLAALAEMGMGTTDWEPVRQGVSDFAATWFPAGNEGESPALAAERARAEAARSLVAMERSKFLPRLGLFAEQSVVSGRRDTENARAIGAYLSWNLFHPTEIGAVKEARLLASAAEHSAQARAESERAERKSLTAGAGALRKNLALVEESLRLLTEQTRTAEGLFRNGSINALQLVEALSRRADLIVSATEARLALLRTESERALKENFTP